MSSNSLLKYLSDYVSNKVINKFFENSCQNVNDQFVSQVIDFCNRMNISSVEYFSSFVSERMIKLLHNLHFTNELYLEYLLLATILFERVLENPLVVIDGNNFVDFFIICVSIFLKFNNDYYYLPCIIRNSQILQYDYSRYEAFVLEALNYKLFISEKEYEEILNSILGLMEMSTMASMNNYINADNMNNNEANYQSYDTSNLSPGTQEKTSFTSKNSTSNNYNAILAKNPNSNSNFNKKKSRKTKKNTVSTNLKEDHAKLVQKIQSSNDEIYNNYMKNYYETQQVQIQIAPVFIIQDL